MSASHHGPLNPGDEQQQRDDLMRRFMDQVNGQAKRQYSAGRIGPDDDGDLALAVAADRAKNVVVIRFGKPVEWIGLGPDEVNGLINLLMQKLRDLGVPATISV
jgi:hypothetical protein